MNRDDPEGAHCFFSGQFYKIGKYNRVFVHRNGEWVFTTGMTLERLSHEIHQQAVAEDIGRTIKRHTL